MTNRKENKKGIGLKDAAYYLIQLYFKVRDDDIIALKNTEQNIRFNNTIYNDVCRCTKTKIEKLLAIVDLIHIKNYKWSLFSEPIHINDCGVGFSQLDDTLDSEIIEGSKPECNQENDFLKNNFFNSDPTPPFYQLEDSLPHYVQNLIENVFFRFGNYSARYLGSKLFDEFKKEIQTKEKNENINKYVIDINYAYYFFNDNKNIDSTNELIRYICSYNIEGNSVL